MILRIPNRQTVGGVNLKTFYTAQEYYYPQTPDSVWKPAWQESSRVWKESSRVWEEMTGYMGSGGITGI